jgi:hypothetical protein
VPATLADDVRKRLSKVQPEASMDVVVNASVTGLVTLSGSASSWEEKLAYSRALRGLPGCTGVLNEMGVPAAVAARSSATRPVSAVEKIARPVDTPRAALSGVVVADGVPPAAAPPRVEPELQVTVIETPKAVKPANAGRTSLLDLFRPHEAPTRLKPPDEMASPQEHVATSSEFTPVSPPPRRKMWWQRNQVASHDNPGLQDANAKRTSDTTASPVVSSSTSTPTESAVKPANLQTMRPRPQDIRTPARKPEGMPSAASQEQIKTKLESTLKKSASKVDLKFDGKGGVQVIVYVTGQADLKTTAESVLQVPELMPYDVKIELRIE